MGKYIIELKDGEHLYKTTINALGNPVMRSAEKVPYTEFDLKEAKEKAYKEGYKAGLDDERDRQPDLEQVKKEAYEKGWKAAEDNYDSGYSDGYDAGLDDIWKAVRKIQEMDIDTLHEVFGWVAGKKDVFIEYTAAKVIERLKTYEQEQNEIKPGDEFENGSGQRFVVLSKRNKEIYRYIDGAGRSYIMKAKYNTIRKTGRSFPEVIDMLEGLYQPAPAAQEEKTAYEIRIQDLRNRLTDFCRKQSSCANCPLNTNEFSCGKGLSFKRMYDDDEKIIPEHDIMAYAVAAGLAEPTATSAQ